MGGVAANAGGAEEQENYSEDGPRDLPGRTLLTGRGEAGSILGTDLKAKRGRADGIGGDTALSYLTPIVAPDDFPARRKSVYLNTASVCLMYSGAERAVIEWMHDLAENGTIPFDEAAVERSFTKRHAPPARACS